MYFSSSAGGSFHTWRQRYPDGRPEQITAGVTQEEGIAVAPDGRSFITSVAMKQSTVWLHEKNRERAISVEGYSYDPQFTPDGKKLLYRVLKGAMPIYDPGELRLVELDSGRNERVLPDLMTSGIPGWAYDVSPDGKRVVAAVGDSHGKRRLWIADFEGTSAPKQVPNVAGYMPHFAYNGDIVFGADEYVTALFSVHEDGTALRKVLNTNSQLLGISPDRQWLATYDRAKGALIAASLRTSASRTIIENFVSESRVAWSPDGKVLYLSTPGSPLASGIIGKTYVVGLHSAEIWPATPPGGYKSVDEFARRTGAQVIDGYDVAPGPVPGMYAYSRSTVQRNLYRIPAP
jgi:WD40 repeat protein